MKNLMADHKRGTTFDGISFSFEEENPDGSFSPLILTGSVVTAEFRMNKYRSVAFSFKTSDGTISIVNNEILLNPRMIDFIEGVYYFEIKITSPDGTVIEPISDLWKIY